MWRKSTYSSSAGNCVEVGLDGDRVLVRDTKQAGQEGRPVLSFTPDEWDAFLSGAARREFDIDTLDQGQFSHIDDDEAGQPRLDLDD